MRERLATAGLVLAVVAVAGQSLGVLPAWAAAPAYTGTFDLVPFRGRVEKDGVPYSSPVNMVFTLYDGADVAFYSETINSVQPADGYFSVLLGGNPAGGVGLSDLLRQKGEAYVGISVDGAALQGRQRLVAAPFSMRTHPVVGADIADAQIETRHLSPASCADGQFHVKSGLSWTCDQRLPRLEVGPSPGPTTWTVAPSPFPGGATLAFSSAYNGVGNMLTLNAGDNSVRVGNLYNGPAEAGGMGTKLRFSGAPDVSDTDDNDNGDNMWIARRSASGNFNELRVNIGDAVGYLNRFVIATSTTGPDAGDWDVYTFDSNGVAFKTGGGSFLNYSDERLKDIQGRYQRGLKELMRLQTIRFRYKAGNALHAPSDREYVGLSAQAVERVVPEAVSFSPKGYRLVDNDPINWTMLNAIQEQQREIESLRERLERLEARGPHTASVDQRTKR